MNTYHIVAGWRKARAVAIVEDIRAAGGGRLHKDPSAWQKIAFGWGKAYCWMVAPPRFTGAAPTPTMMLVRLSDDLPLMLTAMAHEMAETLMRTRDDLRADHPSGRVTDQDCHMVAVYVEEIVGRELGFPTFDTRPPIQKAGRGKWESPSKVLPHRSW